MDDLWDRLKRCYEILVTYEGSGTISFDNLKALLWLALSLEDVDNDDEVLDVKLISYGKIFLFACVILIHELTNTRHFPQ